MAKKKVVKAAKRSVKKSVVDGVKPGDEVFLITTFDTVSFRKDVGDPAVFLTRAAAAMHCKRNSTPELLMHFTPVQVGMVLE